MLYLTKNRKNGFYGIVLLLPLLIVIVVFELLPLVMLLLSSFKSDNDISKIFTFENYIKVLTSSNSLIAIKNSIIIASLSTIVGFVIAYLMTRILRKSSINVRKKFALLFSVISNFSGISLAFSFMLLLGNAGLIKKLSSLFPLYEYRFDLYSGKGLLLLYIFFQIPLATLLLTPIFDGISYELEESSLMLGASDSFFWKKVGLPIMIPSILNIIVILFANAICAYETAYVLLMNNYPLLSLNISAAYIGDMVSKPSLGAAMSIIILLLICIVNFVSKIIMKFLMSGKGKCY